MEIIGLVERVTPQEKRLATCVGEGRTIVVVAEVGHSVAIDVLRDVEWKWHAGVSDHAGADFEAPGQLIDAGGFELLGDVQTVAVA